MNAEARKLGLTGSHFTNATGLPDPDQYVTAHDLARLAKHIISDFPEFYPIYSQTEFTWNKISQHNRNPLLEMNIGADGLKTGYTDESGYGLVGSAVRDGQRLIMVINGTKSEKERAEEARKLMDWGFRALRAGRAVPRRRGDRRGASVFGGEPVVGRRGRQGPASTCPVPRGSPRPDQGPHRLSGAGPGAGRGGQEIGTLRITLGEDVLREAPVYAADDVGVGTMPQRALDGLKELLLGWW